MKCIEFTAPHSRRRPLVTDFVCLLLQKWIERAAIRRLDALSDHHLADIGMTRGTLGDSVRNGRDRDHEREREFFSNFSHWKNK
jgi:uncharacterized protein YjiS (DUF1127 family)